MTEGRATSMLRISTALAADMVAHAQAEHPKEACGILGGREGVAAAVYRMTNIDHSPISYQMEPKEQLQVMKRLRAAEQEMVAIYHSHTASAAYPSPVDVRLAVYPEVSYVLVSLQDQAHPALKSYRIVEGAVTEEPLEVV